MDNIIKIHNLLLDNAIFKSTVILITGIFAGYTLQPVPDWLNDIFDQSYLLKFIVLFYGILVSLHPINVNKVFISAVSSIIILELFKFFRTIN